MTEIRRYDETEIAEILRRATDADREPAPSATAGRGLTLAEIQAAGEEVGIPARSIERAAVEFDRPAPPPPARFLGAQRSVSRVVPLERPMDDDEWTRLVVLLRETFDARGEVETVGQLRSWHNGNLQAHVEPAGDGYRVRMETYKGNVSELMAGGVVSLIMMVITAVVIFFEKGLDPGLLFPIFFGVAGFGIIGGARLALPGWAAEREAQMERIAERIPHLLED